MKPTDLLIEEHHGVKIALRVMEKLAGRIAQHPHERNDQYIGDIAGLIEFCQVFVDKCHHAKEEEVLFPALLDAGLPLEGGPVQVMLAEHVSGRKLIAAMDAALTSYRSGASDSAHALNNAVLEYAGLLTDHIAKEDNDLYPIANARISAEVQDGMLDVFEKIEVERIGVGTHERFHGMLKELIAKYLKP